MKKVIIILVLIISSIQIHAQQEVSNEKKIENLEARVNQLELMVLQLQKQVNSTPKVEIAKPHSKYTPINIKGEIISYSTWEKLENKMTKGQVLQIMGEPYDIERKQQGEKVIENWFYNTAKKNGRSALIFRRGTLSTINFPIKGEDYPN